MTVSILKIEKVIEVLNNNFVSSQCHPLNPPEIMILRGIWEYKTYNQIALNEGYSPGYFTNVVAPELFKRLSQLIGKRVTKKNCQAILNTFVQEREAAGKVFSPKPIPSVHSDIDHSKLVPSYPSGSLFIDSHYYVNRPPAENQLYEEILKPGALVRIKAPQEMGKTSLLLRALDYSKKQGYHTVSLNLQQIDEAILNNLNRFLRWLCANISHQLNLEPKLDEYWDEDIGAKISCTLYIQNYLLDKIKAPIVLALDEVNQIFEHAAVAQDVLPLLRSWYEEAKRLEIWHKLRLIVVHSTEIYVPLQLKQSPFNVGFPIQLAGFTLDQVKQLAQLYQITWNEENDAQQLMELIGGHPALVHLALYHLSRNEVTFSDFLATAHTPSGIYNYHLQRHWATLFEQPKLVEAFTTILNTSTPISIEPHTTYKLSSMGLIQQIGDQVQVSCDLYRKAFLIKYEES